MILIFEVCIHDCPKSWSGLLSLAAARVLGLSGAALARFLEDAEQLFSEESGIVFASEPRLTFFENFIRAALLSGALPVLSAAVAELAERMPDEEAAIGFLAAEFRSEALWLARAGAPIYEALRWILRRTPRPQAAYAWTQLVDLLSDHTLPWSPERMRQRAAEVERRDGTSFWWLGQGGSQVPQSERPPRLANWKHHTRRMYHNQFGGDPSAAGAPCLSPKHLASPRPTLPSPPHAPHNPHERRCRARLPWPLLATPCEKTRGLAWTRKNIGSEQKLCYKGPGIHSV